MYNKILDKVATLKLSPLQRFNENTKLRKLSKSDDPKDWPDDWKRINFKGYPRLRAIKLPHPSPNKEISFFETLSNRKSNREFSGEKVDVQDVSSLLFYSCGIREKTDDTVSFRFYPSAGARFPLEIYPIVLKGNSVVKQGIYHYHVRSHSLEVLLIPPFKGDLFQCFSQKWIKKAALLIVISSVFFRTETKYATRGYRHIMTEVGHLSQNLYLLSAALKLGCCSIGGYLDDDLNKILDIDGLEESVVGITAIGHLSSGIGGRKDE